MVSDYNVLLLLCQYRQSYIKMIVCYNLFLYQKDYAILIFLNITQSHLQMVNETEYTLSPEPA